MKLRKMCLICTVVVLIVVLLRRLEAQTLRHDNAGDRGAAIIQHSRHEDYRQDPRGVDDEDHDGHCRHEELMMKMLMGMVTTIQQSLLPLHLMCDL